MGKVLKGVAIAAAFVGLAFATGGASILAAGATAAAGSVTVAGVTFAAGLGTALLGMAVSSVLAGLSAQFFGPKIPKTQLSRLNPSLDPSASRKAVFGTTAMPLDIRYHEASGTDQEYVDYIIALSAHEIASVDSIYFEENLAWSSGSGVASKYSGYLSTPDIVLAGTSSNYITINTGSKWGSTRLLTGCSYIHLRIKRTGNSKKAESPLPQGLPARVTVIGEGALLYDPRLDSTVPGGSGTHRADDQTTWGSYTDPDDTDNPALQLLWWLLGWHINGKLSVGCGIPPERIDLASFITAANICDESITLADSGTQARYRTSGTASDSDNRTDIINNFLHSMNGTLRDNGGKLALTVMKNDLADPIVDFDDDDILDSFDWQQTRGLDENYNIVRGRYVDPSTNSLYQLVEYPSVSIASPDGIERSMTLDLGYVEDGKRAQRIAKQELQRNQYRGLFTANFTLKALGCSVGDVVSITFTPLGWSNKLFRIVSQEISLKGVVPMSMIEENAAIYAWDADETAPVTPTAPTVYDATNHPYVLGLNDTDTFVSGTINPDGTIVDDKVVTASIVSNSVSKITSANSTSVVNIASTYTVIQQVSFTTDGGPILVTGSFLNYAQPIAAGSHGIDYYLSIPGAGGTQIYYSTQYASGGGATYQFRQQCTLTTHITGVSSGTYTGYLYAKLHNSNSQAATLTADRNLTITELKK